MSTFAFDNQRAKPGEQLVADLLRSWGWTVHDNSANGTADQTRKNYDLEAEYGSLLIQLEIKTDWMSRFTGNFCVEIRAVRQSKSPLFVYLFPYAQKKVYIHAFHLYELESLIRATKMSQQGRIYAYRHVRAGQYQEENVLVPKEVLRTIGRPFEQAIKEITKQAA